MSASTLAASTPCGKSPWRSHAGEVTCVLGDNGAGKSTLIKVLSGVFPPDSGQMVIDGTPVHFASPRVARSYGIATVFQDLATVPLMSLWRNFFLGNEPTRGRGPMRRMDVRRAKLVMHEEMAKMGIDVRDPDQPVGTLSGGERQAVAIARAVYFGANVLILDEPTSALGVRQSGIVLKYILQALRAGQGRDLHHAQPSPRLPRGGPLCPAPARPLARLVPKGGDYGRTPHRDDGRRGRAKAAQPRARGHQGHPVRGRGRSGVGRRSSRRHLTRRRAARRHRVASRRLVKPPKKENAQ